MKVCVIKETFCRMPINMWALWIKGSTTGINDLRNNGKITSEPILENIDSAEYINLTQGRN